MRIFSQVCLENYDKKSNMQSKNNKLAIRMLTAMVLGIIVGIGFMMVREKTGADSVIWKCMTINMDGTAIMQVVATLFLAGVGGYHVTILQLMTIMFLVLIASTGTPAAPGAGAIILFTVLSGVGFTGEAAMMGYALILAINRPIEMLVTSLNCVGDSMAAITVAKSEGKLDETIYNR